MIGSLLVFSLVVRPDRVDEIVQEAMQRQKIPGLAILVSKDGKPVKMKGYGFSNMEHKVLVKPETIFQSGSVGKQFTATLVMMLVKEGKLSLDDSVGRYFPEAKGSWDKVKVKHLLSHTSGLGQLPYFEMDLQKNHSEDDLVKAMIAQKVISQPGETWAYNNGGYVMLGILVRRVTGKFYGDVLTEKIFRPLGMSTARVISEEDIVLNRSAGYVMTPKGLKNQSWVAPITNTTADGALYLSLLDFSKWDQGLLSSKLLPKETLEQMWTPTRLNNGTTANYGYGWFVNKVGNRRLIDHSGAWQGFTTYIGRHVDQKVTVVVLANLDSWNAKTTEIGRAILKEYLP